MTIILLIINQSDNKHLTSILFLSNLVCRYTVEEEAVIASHTGHNKTSSKDYLLEVLYTAIV